MEEKVSSQIAKHFREVYFGRNWTWSNIRENLDGITWQQATEKIGTLNTIATLLFHINYFAEAARKVLEGGPLDSKDIYSFNHPPIHSQADWDKMLKETWQNAETFASLIEKLPDEKLWEDFTDSKYGSYYRNLHGIIEHAHYHLGQIALIRKLLKSAETQHI